MAINPTAQEAADVAESIQMIQNVLAMSTQGQWTWKRNRLNAVVMCDDVMVAECSTNDAPLITAAPQWLRLLVHEVQMLHQRIGELRSEVATLRGSAEYGLDQTTAGEDAQSAELAELLARIVAARSAEDSVETDSSV